MLDQTSKRSIFLFIKTIHSARSGSNLECILVIRRPVAENSRCWCPTQLTDFPIVLIKGIRRHRALDPYQFDSATDASRIFRRVVWTCEVSDVLHCALCLIGYRMGLCSQRSLYFWIASGLIYWKKYCQRFVKSFGHYRLASVVEPRLPLPLFAVVFF